jgi:DNA-binding winged helix-turn-helix (wHTH) protein
MQKFGDFAADRTGYRVFRGDTEVELTPKLLDLLFYFLDRPARLITKDELLEGVWPDANVTDNALAQAISDLRDALGDSPAAPSCILTVARRGYRFIAPVTSDDQARPATDVGAGELAGVPPLAVLDFTNVTHDRDVDWLGAGIAETVTSDLAGAGRFRVIDRWRVAAAVRRAGDALPELAAALGARLLVTGSFQRSGTQVRITARVHDMNGGAVVADAKVDGPLSDVFALQDAITAAFGRALGFAPAAGTRAGARETPHLDAYRAQTEGWLKLESLDTDLVEAAIADFEAAIALDRRYALAYTGLASAEFVAYEMTRMTRTPNASALAAGIEHARHGVVLDGALAEAHATLSFLLTSAGHLDEARRAAQQAVALEPDSWRNQYRLGHALWGGARLRALERTLALYPQFEYARFESAMVHVARGDLDAAEELVLRGIAGQDRAARARDRFPAVGFHWLLGAISAARGRSAEALEEFDREIAQHDRRRLYSPEYAAAACVARGYLRAAGGDHAEAIDDFTRALRYTDGYPRAYLGLRASFVATRQPAAAARAADEVARAIGALTEAGRVADARYLEICAAALAGDDRTAIAAAEALLRLEPGSFAGWQLPIEPCVAALARESRWTPVRQRLADRAK